MLKSLLSLVTSKDKKKSSTVRKKSASQAADSSFLSAAGDTSILNDTCVTLGDTSFVSCASRPRSGFFSISKGRKNRTSSFDFCLSPDPKKEEVVVRRRSLQPQTPTPSPSDGDSSCSFYESIFDSPIQQNRLHSVIGDKIYEVTGSPNSSPVKSVVRQL